MIDFTVKSLDLKVVLIFCKKSFSEKVYIEKMKTSKYENNLYNEYKLLIVCNLQWFIRKISNENKNCNKTHEALFLRIFLIELALFDIMFSFYRFATFAVWRTVWNWQRADNNVTIVNSKMDCSHQISQNSQKGSTS